MTINHFDEMNNKRSKASTTEPIANLTVEPESVAVANLVNELRAAGVVLRVSGNKLTAQPWTALTAEQQRAYRKHRAAMKELIRNEQENTTHATTKSKPTTETPQPEPIHCGYCRRAPCVGPDHFAYTVLHYRDPVEVERRSREQTQVMLKTMPDFRR